MFGSGYGLRTIILLIFLKSVMNRTVLSFFGIIKHADKYLRSFLRDNKPTSLHSLSTSFFVVLYSECGIVYGRMTKGRAFGFSSKSTGSPFHVPQLP